MIDVLFLAEVLLKVHIAHLLADCWLVHALILIAKHGVARLVRIHAIIVRRGGSLLTTLSHLILRQQDSLSMDLLESDIG